MILHVRDHLAANFALSLWIVTQNVLLKIIAGKTFVSTGLAFEQTQLQVGPCEVVNDEMSAVEGLWTQVTDPCGCVMAADVFAKRSAIVVLRSAVVANEGPVFVQNYHGLKKIVKINQASRFDLAKFLQSLLSKTPCVFR